MKLRAVMGMNVFVAIILPIVWTADLWTSPATNRVAWLLQWALVASVLALVLTVARWDLYPRWARFGVLLWFVLVSVVSVTSKVGRLPWTAQPLMADTPTLVIDVVCLVLFLGQTARGVAGRRLPEQGLALQFPLQNGTYCLVQGGSSQTVNYHAAYQAQRYAVDIVKLTGLAGGRARGLYPTDLSRYAIYGAPVYSPCDGIIVDVVNDRLDLPVGTTDPARPAGNHVVIRHDGVKILLAHLEQGSIAVQIGDMVLAGERLGRIGNSGNTSEPHLHIHAERDGEPTTYGDGSGVPIVFDGRFLVRNDLVTRQAPPENRSDLRLPAHNLPPVP